MRALSVFSGVGGLDRAVAEVFGAEPVAFAELDPNASKVLAARWPGVPNVGDVTVARWEDWKGVDVLHGGPPCQPTSWAGKRLGENDERWMWPAALDALRRVRPRWVVWENPSALLGLGGGVPFGRILGEMASIGYVGLYGCLRASDVGACHPRDRLWIVATDADGGRLEGGVQRDSGAHEPRLEAPRRNDADGCCAAAADATDERRERLGSTRDGRGRPTDDDWSDGEYLCGLQREGAVRASVLEGRRGVDGRAAPVPGVQWGDYAPAIARHAALVGRPAPAPVDERGRLSAPFVEWMQAFPAGWVTDVLPRNPALKALGNAVVAPCAVVALRLLLGRIETRVAA